jgi:hypothetical protein
MTIRKRKKAEVVDITPLRCPACDAEILADDVFCSACGHDLSIDEVPTFRCLNRVGVRGEDSLNSYISAYNIWKDCYSDARDPELQRHWSDGSFKLRKARNGLADLEPLT